MESNRRYLKRSEVARLFGVSAHTVTRWANEGKIPYIVTPGGQFRFPEAAILDLVKRNASERSQAMAGNAEREVHMPHCPRCGAELTSTSDMDPMGPYVRCWRCGFGSTAAPDQKAPVVSDADIVRATSMT